VSTIALCIRLSEPSDKAAYATAVEHDGAKSCLRRWAERLRAGDVAVGTVAGSASGALIRALMSRSPAGHAPLN
jgi:hypothetical protein